jgi:hypothetical protein
MIESHRSRKHSIKKEITVEYMGKILADINKEISLLYQADTEF